jgi:uncharacterized SAM-binding protein YcdF (DUF218 family)
MGLFWVKKFLTPFLMPLMLVVYSLGAGVGLLWFSKRQRVGKVLVSVGLVLLLAMSCGELSNSLLRSLEDNYPWLSHPDRSLKWVAVLGGGYRSVVRVVEGVRLYREIPNSTLILCGGGFDGDRDAEAMATVARALGVPMEHMVLELESLDTSQQAVALKKLVGTEPFALVTSASHMSRAMALCKKQGLHPVAAPTERRARQTGTLQDRMLVPNVEALEKMTTVFYEYIGLAWAKIYHGV